VCGFRRDERGEPYGGFFFRGQNVITASVVHQENPSGIDLYFGSWKFIEEEDAIKAFKAPTLSNSAQCWMAEATVELTQLLIMEGPGSDQDGEWLLKYRVIEVGKYKAC